MAMPDGRDGKTSQPSVLITGASAGLGEALARAYAAPGRVLLLIARNSGRLDAVAVACRALGATVVTGVIDVTDWQAMAACVRDFDAAHGLDLAIVNAGVFTGHGPDRLMETPAEIRALIGINLLGLAATVDAVLPGMRARHAGRIALIGSLAALQPQADAPAYSASKAGAMAYGEALREFLIPDTIDVSLVYPGHIKTAQADIQVGAMPGIVSADEAARLIKRGLDRGRTFIAFPKSLLWLIRLGRLAPWRLRAFGGQDFRFHVKKDV